MAKPKTKAGKKAKAAPKKASGVRKAVAKAAPKQAKVATAQTFPCNVLVKKGAEGIPVQVKDSAHLAQLVEEFGEKSVEVQ